MQPNQTNPKLEYGLTIGRKRLRTLSERLREHADIEDFDEFSEEPEWMQQPAADQRNDEQIAMLIMIMPYFCLSAYSNSFIDFGSAKLSNIYR